MTTVLLLAESLAQATTTPVEPLRRATAMFVLVAITLGVLLLAAVLVFLSKRTRRRRAATQVRAQPAFKGDPWTEAGRRVDAPDRGGPD